MGQSPTQGPAKKPKVRVYEVGRMRVDPQLIATMRLKGMTPTAQYDSRRNEVVLLAVEVIKEKPQIDLVGEHAKIEPERGGTT